jgi:hypothetical protein
MSRMIWCAAGSDSIARSNNQMLDIIMLVMGIGFFAVTIGYAYACDRM